MEPFLAAVVRPMALPVQHAGARDTAMSSNIFGSISRIGPLKLAQPEIEILSPIPEYSERLWGQPHRNEILVTDETATMPEDVFRVLKEYSHSVPSGQADGKMWKARWEDNQKIETIWYLRWYSIEDKYVTTHSRKIVIADWKKLLGV